MKNKYELEITGTVFEFDVIKPVFNYRGLDETLKSVLILEDKVKAMIIQNKSDYDRAKKMRSSINKTFNHLEEARKQAHNELEEPYKKFMEKYKEVKDSVERSTGHIDYMKFVIDQREKSMKKDEIADIFDRRIRHYDIRHLFKVDDFLTDKHLNKSFKINEIEAEMTKWMEQREKDVHLILESGDAEWMAAYIKTGMLDLSRQMADNHRREIEETKQLMEMIR